MKFQKLLRSTRVFILVLLTVSSMGQARAAIISSCDQPALEAALAAGGEYTFGCSGTIILTNTLTVTNDVSFDGAGQEVIISGNGAVRIFKVQPNVHLTLANLTVANGRHTGTNGVNGGGFPASPGTPGEPAYGGAISIDSASVMLVSCLFSNNSIKGGNAGGGPQPAPAGSARGGAICNSGGSLTAVNCLFTRNQVTGGVPISGGGTLLPSPDGFGGAICNSNGTLSLSNSIFTLNTNLGVAFSSSVFMSVGPTAGNAYGGAIHAEGGSNSITHCSFALNYALGGPQIA
jgi:hypothetical protein